VFNRSVKRALTYWHTSRRPCQWTVQVLYWHVASQPLYLGVQSNSTCRTKTVCVTWQLAGPVAVFRSW